MNCQMGYCHRVSDSKTYEFIIINSLPYPSNINGFSKTTLHNINYQILCFYNMGTHAWVRISHTVHTN